MKRGIATPVLTLQEFAALVGYHSETVRAKVAEGDYVPMPRERGQPYRFNLDEAMRATGLSYETLTRWLREFRY